MVSKVLRWFGLYILILFAGTVLILSIKVLRNPLWHASLLRLFGNSWNQLTGSMSSNTLGFVMEHLIVPILIFSTGLGTFFILRQRESFWKSAYEGLVAGMFGAVALVCLWSGMWAWRVVKTIYNDHQTLVNERDRFSNSNSVLSSQLENEKQKRLNMMQIERPFVSYRRAIGFSTSCQIKVTAPLENNDFAMAVAQFANIASQCGTFGPLAFDWNPDVERDTMTGMIPDVIIFHDARDDKEGTKLFIDLSNYLPLKRSYNIPSGSPDHFIWLQFGSKAKWNSQAS